MGIRTRAERRHNDFKKAIRKRKITKEVYWSSPELIWDYYDNLHQYSKNKIHCSYPLCTFKTRNRKGYEKRYTPPLSDLRRINEMDYEIIEEIV